MENKYVNAMREIKLSDESKEKIIYNINHNNDNKFKGIKKLIIFSSISIAMIALFAIFNMFNVPINHNLSNIVIIAYAEENNQFTIKPNVDFMINKYSLEMNSVPGMPIKISCDNAKSIKLSTKNGSLLTWDQTTGKVERLGQHAEITSKEIIYWSPLVDNGYESVSNDTITITVIDKNEIENKSRIEIIENDCKCSYKGIYKN